MSRILKHAWARCWDWEGLRFAFPDVMVSTGLSHCISRFVLTGYLWGGHGWLSYLFLLHCAWMSRENVYDETHGKASKRRSDHEVAFFMESIANIPSPSVKAFRGI